MIRINRMTTLLLCILLFCSFEYIGYNKSEPCAKSDMKGKVRSLKQTSYAAKDDGSHSIVETDTLIETYNEKGNITSHYYNAIRVSTDKKNGKTNNSNNKVTATFTYNSKSQLSKKTIYHTVPWADTSVYDYIYDAKGMETEYLLNTHKQSGYSYKRAYNKQGDLSSTITANIPGRTNGNYSVPEIYIYKYSVKNNIKERTMYEIKDGDTILIRADGYDNKGNNIISKHYRNKQIIMWEEYTFDVDGRLLRTDTYYPPDDQVNKKRTFSYAYSDFDSKGNYLTKTNSAGTVMKREIVYYP